jgi:Rrf2 family protein
MLSRSSEYAIRALAYLGTRDGRRLIRGRDIALKLGMPPPFLAKVLQVMAAAGLLRSRRGRNGGFQLTVDPRKLSLLAIVEPFDHLLESKLCLIGRRPCRDEHACPLHAAWNRTRGSLLAALQTTTLADVERAAAAGGLPWKEGPARVVKPRPARRRRQGTYSTYRPVL